MIRMKCEKVLSSKKAEEMLVSEVSKSQKIKALFMGGIELKEISVMMGIRYNFAYNVISNLILRGEIVESNIERTKLESKKDKVIELSKAGKSIKEIAMALKCNYNSVWKILNENKDK